LKEIGLKTKEKFVGKFEGTRC